MNDEKKPPKKRIDSVSSIHSAIVAGGKIIKPPANVKFTPKERLIFVELCNEFSKTELTAHKIRLVATLAKQIAMLDEQQVLLAREGSVVVNSHGNPITNPRAKVCSTLTSTILSLRRSLGIHARELAGGDARRVGIRRAHNKAAEQAMDHVDKEGLLARPNLVSIRGGKEDDDDDRE